MYNNFIWDIRDFGIESYLEIQDQMKNHITQKNYPTIWVGEHPIVITLGIKATIDDVIDSSIHLARSTRGGLTTLHLPGQLVFYPIFQLKEFSVHTYVRILEQVIIDFLASVGIDSFRKDGAPGVYTNRGKIASIGLRVSRGWVYHGFSLNIACSLIPQKSLISCGDDSLVLTSIYDHGIFISIQDVKKELIRLFSFRSQEVVREYYHS